MFETKNTSLEEQIIILLINSSLSAKVIHTKINKLSRSYSLQAIYGQLGKLVSDEVLIKQKQNYSINNDWTTRIKHLFSFKELMKLDVNQKNIYSCATLSEVDKLWKNIFYSLPEEKHVFLYTPEPFWYLLRRRTDSENTFYKEQLGDTYRTYVVINGHGTAAKRYHKNFLQPTFRIEMGIVSTTPEGVGVSVFGDYVLSVSIDPKIRKQIVKLFLQDISENVLSDNINILDRYRSKHKLTIEHNPKKALLYKKRIGKYFFSRKKMEEIF